MDYKIVLDKVISISSEYGIKVIGAIAIWIIGSWAIKKTNEGSQCPYGQKPL